ncbi:hypothetical protein ACLB2K_012293 [Fragaria x ananassa]
MGGHKGHASIEEAADPCLMPLVYEAKGDYESALEHLVLAFMLTVSNVQDNEVAAIDVGIRDIYSCLWLFDEAVFSYQKAFIYKSTTGENHLSVASALFTLLICITLLQDWEFDRVNPTV